MKNLLILSGSIGAGHVRAAQAIQEFAEMAQDDFCITQIDVMEYVNKPFKKMYSSGYLYLIKKFPKIWKRFYKKTDKPQGNTFFERGCYRIQKFSARKLFAKIDSLQPDHIILTHFLPAELIARAKAKNKFSVPVSVVITDHDAHWKWIQKELEHFCVSNSKLKERLIEIGIPSHKINVTGIPISKAFYLCQQAPPSKVDFGFEPNKPLLLLMAGGQGLNQIDKVADKLLRKKKDLQIISVAGNNKELFAQTEKVRQKYPNRMLTFAFTNQVEKLMAVSDMIVTKPGGLTTSECLAMELPMILLKSFPGQEENNAAFLVAAGVAILAKKECKIVDIVDQLIENPNILLTMKQKCKEIANICAGEKIIKSIYF